jgi:hypothetical protein
MDTFKKRQKEMKRLERQRDKAIKRQEIKARKAAGIVDPPDEDLDTPLDGPRIYVDDADPAPAANETNPPVNN